MRNGASSVIAIRLRRRSNLMFSSANHLGACSPEANLFATKTCGERSESIGESEIREHDFGLRPSSV